YLLHGAGEVQVDDVVSCLLKQAGRSRHRLRLGTHDLSRDRMIFIVDVDRAPQAFAAVDHDGVEEGFGDGVGTAAAAGDNAHGAVAVPGKAGLAEWNGKLDGADAGHDPIIVVQWADEETAAWRHVATEHRRN